MYTPRTSVEAILDASIHHSALQKQQHQLAIGHMYRCLIFYLDGQYFLIFVLDGF